MEQWKIFLFFISTFFLSSSMEAFQRTIIGKTVKGEEIVLYQKGDGANYLTLLLHITKEEMELLSPLFEKEKLELPNDKTLCFILLPKQETEEIETSWQRNFPTKDWKRSNFYYSNVINCGDQPLSFPESQAINSYLQETMSHKKNHILLFFDSSYSNIYLGDFSSFNQNLLTFFKKKERKPIIPLLHGTGRMERWLAETSKTAMIRLPISYLIENSEYKLSELLKLDFSGKIFKKNGNSRSPTSFSYQLFLSHLPNSTTMVLIEESKREEFYYLIEKMLEQPELILLVNKKHFLSSEYLPSDLENIDSLQYSSKKGIHFRSIAIPSLKRLFDGAESDGVKLSIVSSYRSYDTQKAVFSHWVKEFGRKEAERVSAKPGASQHQLGTAIDFNMLDERFSQTREGKWLSEHAYEYGFILSFPKGKEEFTGYSYEPWHFRYIGEEAAKLVSQYFQNDLELFLQWIWSFDIP